MTNKIQFNVYKQDKLQKCNLCEKVKPLTYKITIYDNENTNNIIVSELQSCKICGDNLYSILNPDLDLKPNEVVKKTFTFSK